MPIAINTNCTILHCCGDEVRDCAAVFEVHVGSVGVEDAGYADGEVMLGVVGVAEGFGDAFAFVVA
jgi:hypothetical protein